MMNILFMPVQSCTRFLHSKKNNSSHKTKHCCGSCALSGNTNFIRICLTWNEKTFKPPKDSAALPNFTSGYNFPNFHSDRSPSSSGDEKTKQTQIYSCKTLTKRWGWVVLSDWKVKTNQPVHQALIVPPWDTPQRALYNKIVPHCH